LTVRERRELRCKKKTFLLHYIECEKRKLFNASRESNLLLPEQLSTKTPINLIKKGASHEKEEKLEEKWIVFGYYVT
jgi:hypothetical protein